MSEVIIYQKTLSATSATMYLAYFEGVLLFHETYYFARFRNQTNTYPEKNNPIFSDPNGENPINDTAFSLNISMDNGDVIQVKRGMVIGVPTGCT